MGIRLGLPAKILKLLCICYAPLGILLYGFHSGECVQPEAMLKEGMCSELAPHRR